MGMLLRRHYDTPEEQKPAEKKPEPAEQKPAPRKRRHNERNNTGETR